MNLKVGYFRELFSVIGKQMYWKKSTKFQQFPFANNLCGIHHLRFSLLNFLCWHKTNATKCFVSSKYWWFCVFKFYNLDYFIFYIVFTCECVCFKLILNSFFFSLNLYLFIYSFGLIKACLSALYRSSIDDLDWEIDIVDTLPSPFPVILKKEIRKTSVARK